LGYKPLRFHWHKRTALTLAGWGGAALASGLVYTAVDTLIRARLISMFGVAENGLYQAALLLCTQVTTVILGSIGAYSLAALSQTRDTKLVELRLANLLRTILPVSTITLGFLGVISQPLLSVLFSKSFDHGAKFLPLLISGNFVQAAAWVIGAPLLG